MHGLSTSNAPQAPTGVRLEHWLAEVPVIHAREISVDARVIRPVRFAGPACAVVRGLLIARLRRAHPQLSFDAPSESAAHGSHAPRTVWIRGLPAQREIAVGPLDVRLVLVGSARAAASEIQVALQDVLSSLGRGSGAVEVHGAAWRTLEIFGPRTAPHRGGRIDLATPVLLELGPKDTAMCPSAPWLPLFVRASVRRIAGLVHTYSPHRLPRLEYPPAYRAELGSGRLQCWTDSRFSRRQSKRHPLTGWTGSVEFGAVTFAEFGPLFEFAASAQIGKHTAMGFGHVVVSRR